jgi:hypothetical protein
MEGLSFSSLQIDILLINKNKIGELMGSIMDVPRCPSMINNSCILFSREILDGKINTIS